MAQGLNIGPIERIKLGELRDLAAATPVNMRGLAERLKAPDNKAAHVRQMTAQTVEVPIGYLVTFSIETGHPGGVARHLSVSVARRGKLPHPAAVWMIAEALGFVGSLELCDAIWPEKLQGHGQALNIVQLIAQPEPARRQ